MKGKGYGPKEVRKLERTISLHLKAREEFSLVRYSAVSPLEQWSCLQDPLDWRPHPCGSTWQVTTPQLQVTPPTRFQKTSVWTVEIGWCPLPFSHFETKEAALKISELPSGSFPIVLKNSTCSQPNSFTIQFCL